MICEYLRLENKGGCVVFEGAFNLKFNLNKAYTDINIKDDDAPLQAAIYGLSAQEYSNAVNGFEQNNHKNAQEVLAAYGAFSPVRDKPFKIAYLGDSITSDRESHLNIVRDILKEYNNIDIRDFAISGYKASDIFTAFYPGIAEYAPDIAVMMIGTNDMRITDDEYGYHHGGIKEFDRNINYILEKLDKMGCKVILCTLPPFDMEKMNVALSGWKILYTQQGWEQYDECLVRAAEKQNAILVDMRGVYAAYDAAELTIKDGLHLNGKGQTLLAKEVFGRLAPLLEG